jgi:hypothetical protein
VPEGDDMKRQDRKRARPMLTATLAAAWVGGNSLVERAYTSPIWYMPARRV